MENPSVKWMITENIYIYIFPIYSETNIYIYINTEYLCTIFFMKVYIVVVFFFGGF